jgi:GH24 family phage-related lysozyme (muramidase)
MIGLIKPQLIWGAEKKMNFKEGDEMLQNVERAKALAAAWIRRDESFALEVYPDPGDGSPRIGYGSACPPGMTECDWITAERMMQADIECCAQDVQALLGPMMTRGMALERLAVLFCMCYQLGYTGMCKFQRMTNAIFQHNHDKVADEMLDSNWHTQTPERCERLALIYRRGSE